MGTPLVLRDCEYSTVSVRCRDCLCAMSRPWVVRLCEHEGCEDSGVRRKTVEYSVECSGVRRPLECLSSAGWKTRLCSPLLGSGAAAAARRISSDASRSRATCARARRRVWPGGCRARPQDTHCRHGQQGQSAGWAATPRMD